MALQVFKLVKVDGGLNTRVGEEALQLNESPFNQNWELALGGGLQKSRGFEEIVKLPFPIQGLLPYLESGSNRTRVLAYAFPEIYEVDLFSRSYSSIPRTSATSPSFFSDGDPFIVQYGSQALILDGSNIPIFFTGTILSNVSEWPPVFSSATSMIEDPYVQGNRPTLIGNPKFGAVYQDRAFLSGDSKNPRIIYVSQAGRLDAWQTNIGVDVPNDIADAYELKGCTGDITALITTSDALMIFTATQTYRMTGRNVGLPGLDDPFRIELINSQIGCLSHHLVWQQDKSDIYFYSKHGLYNLKLADNFGTVRPGGLSYPIQKDLDQIGTGGMTRAKMINNPAEGVLYLATPKLKTHRYRDKLWKLNYAVNPAANPWSVLENFGIETRLDSLITIPPHNDVYVANYDKIFKANSGPTYFVDGNDVPTEIQAIYDFRPIDFNVPRNNKKIKDYHIKYKCDVDTTLLISHAWSSGETGLTQIFLPLTLDEEFGTSSFDDEGGDLGAFTSSASLSTNEVIQVVSGTTVGKSLKIRVIESGNTTSDLEIFEINISYEILGQGA